MIFESLLGPIAPDPALLLRCVIMFPCGEALGLVRGAAGDLVSGFEGSVGVGGVLTITGGTLSPASGGVWGGLRGSSLVGREMRRGLPVDVLSKELVAARLRSRFGTGSCGLSAASTLGLLSSLELCSEVKFFLERKTSRNRPADDFVLTARTGARLVSLVTIDGVEELRLSTLPPGRVVVSADVVGNSDIWDPGGCGSGL